MKNFLPACLILYCIQSSAQIIQIPNPGECNTSDPSPINLLSSPASCTDYNYYIPDVTNNFENTPVITFKINFHLFRKSDGTGVIQPSDIPFFNSMVANLNYLYANIQQPTLPAVTNPPYISDSRIQFRLMNIYFHDDDNYYQRNVTCQADYLNAYGSNTQSEVNVFFFQNPLTSGSCGPQVYVNMTNVDPAIQLSNVNYLSSQSGLLAHELGHAVGGLFHTWSDFFSDTYYPDNNTAWLSCNITNITNNIMGYNSCRTYLSPMQMGYYHLRANTGVTTKYLTFCDFDPLNTVIVQTSQTWDRSRVIGGDLIINSGVTLTVHCTVSLPVGGKVIVQRGAKLIIDQGIFTNICGQRWKGIEVWGNPNVGQSNTTSNGQGQVTIINGAIIEKAEIAVTVTRIDPNGQPNFAYDGGIIRAQNAFFKNNIIGIQLWSYHGNTTQLNYSYVKNCTFETNSAWPNTNIYPKHFVDLYDVDYTTILGCTFQNLIPNSFPVGNRGEGIFSVDARFRVGNLCANLQCTSVITSTFTNLTYGVNASASMPLLTCMVDGATFNNCDKGVSIRGIDYATITRGIFNITPGTLSVPHFGIYADNCTAFQIDGNTCTGLGNPAYNVGVVIRDSRDMSNIVYNNSFTNLHVGEEALGDNDGCGIPDGLRFNCNDNLDNLYDIYVTNPTNQNNITTDIGKIQGLLDFINPNPQQLVRNTYSAPCVASNENRFRMDKVSSQIATHNNHLTPSTSPVLCKDNRVVTSNINYTFNKPQDCPSSFVNNVSYSILSAQLDAYRIQINSQKILIDGNNTQALLNSISTGSPEQIKNALLAVGPYLSDQVLLAVIAKSLPPEIFKDIIIPNSPVTPTVKQAIDAISLPNGIRNQIDAVQTGISEREKLENHIDQLQFERDLLLSSEIRLILNDTTFISPIDTVISIIRKENIPDQKCKLASAYIVAKDFVKADSILTAIEAEQSSTLDNFCQLNRNLIELRQSIQGYLILHSDSVKRISLEQIAAQVDQDGCSNAQALLMKAFAFFYPEDVVFPDEGQSFRIGSTDSLQQSQALSDFRAYPNPATDKLNVDYKLPSGVTNPILIVFDLTGKTIIRKQLSPDGNTTQLNITELPSGLFFWRIEAEGEILHSDKFSIVR